MARKRDMTTAELLAAAQAMGGIGGREALPTSIVCPSCEAEGRKTISGGPATLDKVDGKLICIALHGVMQ